jgi:hypothetical protein
MVQTHRLTVHKRQMHEGKIWEHSEGAIIAEVGRAETNSWGHSLSGRRLSSHLVPDIRRRKNFACHVLVQSKSVANDGKHVVKWAVCAVVSGGIRASK